MAFDRDNFAKISSGYAHIVSPQMFSYLSAIDFISEFFSPGYFDEINQEDILVRVGDLFLLQDPTAGTLGIVSSINPIVVGPAIVNEALGDDSVTTPKIEDAAVTTPKIEDAAVTTPKIEDAAVTLDKLAPNITPGAVLISHTFLTTVGGSAIETFDFSPFPIFVGDSSVVTMSTQGSAGLIVEAAIIIAGAPDLLQVTFSADPGNSTLIDTNIFRDVP